MAKPDVYLVHLRRPDMKNPNEQRDDPYYEFGSFGCTRCHSRNLFNPRNAAALDGARLAFMQGGRQGFRLVVLTPPIAVTRWPDCCEARWSSVKPFKYAKAPILAYKHGDSHFPLLLKKFAPQTARSKVEVVLSHHFRSRTRPLPEPIADELTVIYERLRKEAKRSDLTWEYYETLPFEPPKIDQNREESYYKHVRKLGRRTKGLACLPTHRRGCGGSA